MEVYIIEIEETFHGSEKIDFYETIGYFTSYEDAVQFLKYKGYFVKTYENVDLEGDISLYISHFKENESSYIYANIKKLNLLKK